MLKHLSLAALAGVALSVAVPMEQTKSESIELTDEFEQAFAGFSDPVWGWDGESTKDELLDIRQSTQTQIYYDEDWDTEFVPNFWTNTEEYNPVRILSEDDQEQIRCLTDNLYYEARGEPREGQIAVVDVVFNRAESDSALFPGTTPCEIIYQRNRRGCQFSWVCGHGYGPIRNREIYEELEALATQLYINPKKADVTNGALWYHADYVRPRWASVYNLSATYGRHRFYEE